LGTTTTTQNQAYASPEAVRTAFELVGVVTWDWTYGEDTVNWSEGLEGVYGRPREEVTFSNWESFVHPEDGARLVRLINEAITNRSSYEGEIRVSWPDGSEHWVLARGKVYDTSEGQPPRLAGVLMNITARKRKEAELRDREERLQAALKASGTGTFRWDMRTDELEWDEELNRLFGLLPGETVRRLDQFITKVHPDDRAEVITRCERCVALGEDFDMEYRVVWPDNSIHWLHDRGKAYYDTDGNPIYLTGACVDITARKRAEEILRKQEKLALVGRLTSSIAHEINNPLQAVTDLLYLADSAQDGSLVANYIKVAQTELARVSQIAANALQFHRPQLGPKPVAIDALLDSVLSLFESRLRHAHIGIEKDYIPTSAVWATESELRQVFANLLSNACDALAQHSPETKPRLALRLRQHGVNGSSRVHITIADSGAGMSPETQQKLFQPFFTTKEAKGTGLGLWISSEIVNKHRGKITVKSRLGLGTLFHIALPASQPASA